MQNGENEDFRNYFNFKCNILRFFSLYIREGLFIIV
uniref:Uncharacterized protein n=1 Tax=Siphoviridae sp. ctwuP1 TaxID=2827972 RepID=A0A8S5TCA6_9CAUD|nr:MAG TPA: hypothetical protein [Siphoviridae sp. ctwuP1]